METQPEEQELMASRKTLVPADASPGALVQVSRCEGHGNAA
jgi:hypothetical protein